MSRTLLAALVVASVQSASAHQLDEYLQATRIAVERDRIVVEMSLTPGVAVADEIFASIDRDSDHQISGPEIEAYGRIVLQDLLLEFDGRSYPLALARAECPPWSEMREGLGAIRLQVTADAPVGMAGYHHLQFSNMHRPDISVYLVNPLVPSSRTFSIIEQQRDMLQHGIRLNINVTRSYTSASWIFVPVAGMTAFIVHRRRCAPRRAYRRD